MVYLLAWLAALPLQLVMIYNRPEEIKAHYNASTYLQVFQFDNSPLLLFLLLIAPVLTGLLVFRYLQTSHAADMEHSLPIRRETLYNTHLLSGLIFLLVPIVITALVTWAVVNGLKIDFVTNQHIIDWLKVALVANLFFFFSTVTVGMITGLSILQGLLTYILLLVPAGLSMLLFHNLQMYVYGFAGNFYIGGLNSLIPLVGLLESPNSNEIIVYLLICVALYFIGRFLYQQRHIEAAGEAITIGVLRPIFKYSVTFCTMLLVGSYFYRTQQNIAWTYLGYFLGAALGYILIEILYKKSVHVFDRRSCKGLGIYAVIAVALVGLVHSDFTGYETRMPQIDQVEYVYMDTYYNPWLRAEDSDVINQSVRGIYLDSDNVNNIMALHQQIIAQKEGARSNPLISPYRRLENICLAYQLKDGKRLYRNYVIDAKQYRQQLKPIHESLEFKTHHFDVLRVNTADVKLVDIRSEEGNKRVTLTDPQLIQEAIVVLQQDIKMQTYEEMNDSRPPWGHVEITLPKPQIADADGVIQPEAATTRIMVEPKDSYYICSVSWQKSYTGFQAWLKGTRLLDRVRLIPGEDIIHAIIEYYPEGLDENEFRTMRAGRNPKEKPEQMKITDADKIELCLFNYWTEYTSGPVYKVLFELKGGGSLIGILTPATAPDFVKQHFAG